MQFRNRSKGLSYNQVSRLKRADQARCLAPLRPACFRHVASEALQDELNRMGVKMKVHLEAG